MLPMYRCPNTNPLFTIHSAASGVFNQIPTDAYIPSGLSGFFSHTISSIWYPFAVRPFSSTILSIPSFSFPGMEKSIHQRKMFSRNDALSRHTSVVHSDIDESLASVFKNNFGLLWHISLANFNINELQTSLGCASEAIIEAFIC
jgi:hypothetical protein